ncbi:MAG TPA: T3SS effector HopA1 family protein [Pseudonocardia sp.]|nr:T3SS effector HopA1 family protein [Pseudonocardia sp.]
MDECSEIDGIRESVATLLARTRDGGPRASDQVYLTDRVYTVVHTRQDGDLSAFPSNRGELAALAADARSLLADLRIVRDGFRVVSRAGGSMLVRCPDGVELSVPAAEVLPGHRGLVGLSLSGIAYPVHSQWIHWAAGFDGVAELDARVYVNARVGSAVRVWCTLVRQLAHGPVPFTSKVGGSRQMLRRADSIVVYVRSSDVPSVLDLVGASGMACDLDEPVPGFSRRLGPGTGVALVPDDIDMAGGSVGYHWARRLVRAWCEGGDEATEPVYEALSASWSRLDRLIRRAEPAELRG